MPHFEIHAKDVDKAKAFYAGLFGWTYQAMPDAADLDYHLIEGADIGTGKCLTGAFLRRPDAPPAPGGPIRGATLTFEVADCDASYQWALENGGAEALPPTDYPGFGRAAYVEDGEGNVVGMITPAQGDN